MLQMIKELNEEQTKLKQGNNIVLDPQGQMPRAHGSPDSPDDSVRLA